MKKEERNIVFDKYSGHCAYCGKEITIDVMQVDHIEPLHNGGEDSIENKNPSCKSCNHYKRGYGLEGFRKYMMKLHERIIKDYISRVANDYGIINITPFSGKFYFEN